MLGKKIKMTCKLCKKESNTIICDKCVIDIQLAFSWYIAGKEVTRTEYEDKINGRNT